MAGPSFYPISSPSLKASKAQGHVIRRRLFLLTICPSLLFVLIILYASENLRELYLSVISPISEPERTGYGPDFWDNNPTVQVIGQPGHPHRSSNQIETAITHATHYLDLRKFGPIPLRSLTAVLPVTPRSLPKLEAIIVSLLRPRSQLSEVILICSEGALSMARRISRRAVSVGEGYDHLEISIRPWTHSLDTTAALMHVASEVTTDWIIFLDENGLEDIDQHGRDMLLKPRSLPLPTGPRGIVSVHANVSCVIPSEVPQLASFLLPPFVIPSNLVKDHSASKSWSSLGEKISHNMLEQFGGVVVGSETSLAWCSLAGDGSKPYLAEYSYEALSVSPAVDALLSGVLLGVNQNISGPRMSPKRILHTGIFAMLFPSLQDLQIFSAVACRLQDDGNEVHVLLYEDHDIEHSIYNRNNDTATLGKCRLQYDTLSSGNLPPPPETQPRSTFVFDWLETFERWPDIIIALEKQSSLSSLEETLELGKSLPTLVLLPQADLRYCEWMGSLSVEEWRNWNVPQLDVSVITNERPESLDRLLSSLSKAKFFGDTLNLRINLEQSSDSETMRIVERFQWRHGSTAIHHRVVHGGLLPAVVESWYPHTNNSYGLLLEDDVELSPMFYAWVKMTVLRYRHGKSHNRSPELFGISLYQQKNNELKPEGRRPFDARALFFEHRLSQTNTPYMSPIPCSWGAVYFPEHWREFHEYLSVRLSEYSFSIDEEIVPYVRSNRWAKSWKKFFIELVYLRGYVMLYPNYEDYVSLSTNHLEVGSHVKDLPRDVYLRRKQLFLLPLMALPDDSKSFTPPPGLLDLPGQTLPALHQLPILNLTGSVTSQNALIGQGEIRRRQLTGCLRPALLQYDVRDLMCIDASTSTAL